MTESVVRTDPDRWRPSRAGLINVWQYANEVLEFEQGRMVLYGPNGSGKTMALELLLPYLLDARAQPGRLSTSGADRGGLWSRVTGYDEREPRTGFLWVEFQRASGSTFTCGTRLRANASGGGDKHWFTTTQRVGHDLELLDGGGHPLGPERLREAIGAAGTLWGSDTTGYRTAVREVLFPGRSEEELEALIRTLLVVRQQNVSDGLSTRRLSALLSQALPPLDELELGKVAEGFADLDRRRDHIAGLEDDLRVTRHLVRANRDYARAWSARVVQRVVSATTDFDRVTRELKQVEANLAVRRQHVEDVHRERGSLEAESVTLHGEKEALEQSDAYREGQQIAELEGQVADRAMQLRRSEADTEREQADAKRHGRSAALARGRKAEAERSREHARRDLEQAVERLGGPSIEELSSDAVAPLVSTWVERRVEAVALVRGRLHAHALAEQRREDASGARTRASERLDEAEERLRAGQTQVEACETQWWERVRTWRDQAVELHPFLELPEEPLDARSCVTVARGRAREPLVEQRAEVVARGQALDEELEVIEKELAQWRAGREPEPDAPRGRRDRAGLAGAPLWRLLEFGPQLSQNHRDRLEAALLACGLLDAWVSSDGVVELDAPLADTLVRVPELHASVPARALPLIPDPAVTKEQRAAVSAVLASITWVDDDAHRREPSTSLVVGLDGSWRTPHLAGRAFIEPARFVGAASRQAARQAAIEDLERRRGALQGLRAACGEDQKALERRLVSCDEELATFPGTEAILAARRELDDARSRLSERKIELHAALERLREASSAARASEQALVASAAEHALPSTSTELDAVELHAKKIGRDLDRFQRTCRGYDHADQLAGDAETMAREADARVERALDRAREHRLAHERMATKLRTLRASVGKPFRELLERLEQIRSRLLAIGRRREELRERDKTLAEKIGRLSTQRDAASGERERAQSVRTAVHDEFLELCREGLVADADLSHTPQLDTLQTLTAQLESARRVRAEAALGAAPTDAVLSSRLAKVHKWQHTATAQLAGRISVMFEPQAGTWSVLRARQDGIVVSGRELHARLTEDRSRAIAELDHKQQELFEEILTGSLREHLKARLWSATTLVERINGILGEVRSAAGGVGVTLDWDIDPELPEAVQLRRAKLLLLKDSPVSDGRAELDAFLRNRVEQVRADEHDTGDWRERLERMLDYRDWHHFVVKVHHNRFGLQPRPLASRNVSLSAGEKTIVMVLPLLVAVVAHYEPASEAPPCQSPRLLLMDELFPKLDFNNKRQLMALLPRLELDGVFTSDKDRCEYDTLDGIAIHLFAKLPDDKTTTTRMVWNGRTLTVTSNQDETS